MEQLDYFGVWGNEGGDPVVISEIIYWERPQGRGRAFCVGSIAAGFALQSDPKLQTLLQNVLAAFGV